MFYISPFSPFSVKVSIMSVSIWSFPPKLLTLLIGPSKETFMVKLLYDLLAFISTIFYWSIHNVSVYWLSYPTCTVFSCTTQGFRIQTSKGLSASQTASLYTSSLFTPWHNFSHVNFSAIEHAWTLALTEKTPLWCNSCLGAIAVPEES